MTFKLTTAARKLKVTAVLDAEPFAIIGVVPDNVPSRTEITIVVGNRIVTADVATKGVRKAVKTIADSGVDSVAIVLQGVLVGDRIDEAGLVAQVKAAVAA